MKKTTIPVKGMHCRSCEMLIEDHLSRLPGVKKAHVSYKKKSADIYHDDQRLDMAAIGEAIREAGYDIGLDDKKYLLSSNPEDYKDLGIAVLFLVGIYLILKNFGILNLNFGVSTSNPSSLWVILLIGVTAGFSTCMALVGGLTLGISARHAEMHPEATPLQKFKPHLFFNLGRIATYAFLGGILGSLGSVFQLSSFTLGILTIAVGTVMLIMGLQLIEIFPIVNGIKFTLPKFVSHALGIKKHHEKEYSHKNSAILGGLTFFLPCGFTQAMQLFAMSTGNFFTGALVMGTFALGTAPGLLGIGGLTSVVRGIFAKRFFKFAGVLVIFFSVFNIANGYNLTGWQLGGGASSSAIQGTDPNVTIENGVQIVKMTESARGYSPNSFTIKKGVPVKWVIDAQAPNSCASSLVISKLGVNKHLQGGENTIEFTPNEVGPLKFSCSMGMYTGVFNVVDEQGNGGNAVVGVNNSNSGVATPATGGSCGGGGGGCGGCGGGAKKPVVANEGKTEKDSAGSQEQVINTSYTYNKDIQPNTFTVKVGQPVKFIVDVQENGSGCMSTIMIPGLDNNPQYLQAGQKLEMDFTPTKAGDYPITCAMGVPRGTLKVIN